MAGESSNKKCKRSASSSLPPQMPDSSGSRGGGEVTVDGAVIKGYHIFRRRPMLGMRLPVQPEPDNALDGDAMVVMMPSLANIKTEDLDVVTDRKRSTKVRDIAGKVVGRVPMGLSAILSRMKSAGELAEITCVATGEPRKSFAPWPMPGEKGGGVVIPCKLHLQVTNRERTIEALRATFQSDLGPEKDALSVALKSSHDLLVNKETT
ncbi:uncharacterized protein [Branchiostoma lanceolatum]|uniref:uncharacterized protein n=1 Tax=Branchiostoma lanceolatum TaxID=7740 RepID=UPI003452844E